MKRAVFWTPERVAEAQALRDSGKDWPAVADVLAQRWGQRFSPGAIGNACRRPSVQPEAQVSPPPPVPVEPPPPPTRTPPRALVIDRPPSDDEPVEALIEHRIAKFQRKRAHEEAKKLVAIRLPDDKPIGILHFGDPHLDDDGTDLAAVRAHGELVRNTPGLYGANVGDTTNNWIGRLARLYAMQSTTARQAWRLAEWFVRDLVGPKWLYMIAGNHDLWSGTSDPLEWISREAHALYLPDEIRVALRWPGGAEVRIWCRHQFAGNSMWNPAHAGMKALAMRVRDHLAIAGHLHISAHGLLRDEQTGIAMQAVQVASYKRHDSYAREKGMADKSVSPCAVTVIDPRLPADHPDLVKLFWDPARGAEYLTFLRGGQ